MPDRGGTWWILRGGAALFALSMAPEMGGEQECNRFLPKKGA